MPSEIQRILWIDCSTACRNEFADELADYIDRAKAIIDGADDDYAAAADHFAKTRSATVFSGVRRAKAPRSEFTQQFVRGLGFNLPIILLGITALVIFLTR